MTEVAQGATYGPNTNLQSCMDALRDLPDFDWAVREDPNAEGRYYVSGSEGTEPIAEGMSYRTADALSYLVRTLPRALAEARQLYQGYNDSGDTVVEVVKDLQTLVRQGSDITPSPPVTVAEDLGPLHLGHFLILGDETLEIRSIERVGEALRVQVKRQFSPGPDFVWLGAGAPVQVNVNPEQLRFDESYVSEEEEEPEE